MKVEFQNVIKRYDEQVVIDGISLALPEELTIALVGESGSGKSTLLQLINGLVIPDTGRVLIDATPLDYGSLTSIRRRMGYVVQGAGLFPHLTVIENITLVATLERWPAEKIRNRCEHLLELLELPLDFTDRYPHMLSGGQQQRVSLCRAMMLDPPLLLLDEPFSALDPITREGIHEEFKRLQAIESRSILLVTHDMGEAVKLAQYLVIMKNGVIVRHGDIDVVRQDPQHDYVSELFAGAEVE